MNQRIAAYNTLNIEKYRQRLERRYGPSTFKFVKIRNFMDGISEIFSLSPKSNKVSLYAQENDTRIDEKSIENDLAVVANDFMISVENHGKNPTLQGRKR